MARNEEKQLARLNRYYLEKQKQEELKKHPPRPRLDTLNTPRELRKWLPTITRDIEFYVKQMEVTCYTDSKIAEFQDRIQRLKQEYGAYLRKLRTLEPDLNAASWADRPYAHRKRPHNSSTVLQERKDADDEGGEEPVAKKSSSHGDGRLHDFVPIPTPVLQNMTGPMNLYNLEKPAPVVWNVNPETEDQPLQFAPATKRLAICHRHTASDGEIHSLRFGLSTSLAVSPHTSSKECGGSGIDRVESEKRALKFSSCESVRVTECVCVDRKESRSLSTTIHAASTVSTDSSTQSGSVFVPAVQVTSQSVCKGHTNDNCVGGRRHPGNTGSSLVCGNEQSQDCASLDVVGKESSGQLVCSNPLNLDYSDSSDEDV